MSREDHALVGRMLAGDERAFDEFFDGYFPGLYRFALTRLDRDHDAAEEVAQATICRAITKLATYRGEAALFTWLCTFCRHEISSYCRRNRRVGQVELIEDTAEVQAALETASGQADVETALERAEVGRLVQVALDQLPPHYGSALEWKYCEGLSTREIALRLRLSPKAAESLLTRAREAFREGFTILARALRARPWRPHGEQAS